MEINKSYKDKAGKVSLLEISPSFILGMAERLNENKVSHGGKYLPFNWKGSDPVEIFEAFQRHSLDIHCQMIGLDPIIDHEDLANSILAAAVNLMFLHELITQKNDTTYGPF